MREFEQRQFIKLQKRYNKGLVPQASKQAVVILISQFVQSLSNVA